MWVSTSFCSSNGRRSFEASTISNNSENCTKCGHSSGVLSSDVYTWIILMVAVTTIITPIWLKKSYKEKSSSDIVR